jgi:tetratricopeptide (TPR) repeat protein/KaiC/GvpD/RAD55 family RecA-like ATPase
MNILKEAIYKAVHGEGGLVFVHGEAGIGKTRLVNEVGAYARSRGVQVLYGRCPALFRMDGVPPYIIWKEVIKDYVETCTLEHLDRVVGFYPAEVAKLVPEISQKLRTIPQSFQISPEQEQNRLFEAVSQFITNISREAPLLVVLDDLQWTDPSSLLLLHYLARGVQKTSLLLLGAYRSTNIDAKHPLTPILTELNRERLPQSVYLKRMSPEDISEVIKQMLEQDDVPLEFCKMIYEKTRGNPFFAEEVIKSLKEEEIIYREENRWKIKEITKIEFPETVKSLIKARIDRLDNEHQNVLTMASLVGNDFTFSALQGVIGLEEDKLRKIVDELLKTGLLKHRVVREEDVCSFADIIVRDVVYEEVGTFERKKLHRSVGTALEKVYARKVDEHLGELALHFLEGGDKEKALDYFLKAGEKAQKTYANAEATSYYRSALRLLEGEEGDYLEKGRVLEVLGDVERFVGEYEACMKHWNETLLLWMQMDEKGKTSRLHRKMANVLWDKMGKTEEARHHHDRALRILEAEPEGTELAALYQDICHMLWHTGDLAIARPWAEKTLELAKKLNAHEVIANAYIDLGAISSLAAENWKRSVECYEKALRIALDKGFMESALRAYCNLSNLLPAEEHERALECQEKGLELAKKVGSIYFQSWIGSNLAYAYIGMGNTGKAMLLGEESVALDRKSGNMTHLPRSVGLLGFIHQILGELDKSEQLYMEALSLSQESNEWRLICGSYEYLAWFHFDKGEYVKAREFWEKTYELSGKAGGKYQKMWAFANLLRTRIELGKPEEVADSFDGLYKFFQEVGDNFILAWIDTLRAVLFRAQHKWEESTKYFERSLHEWEFINAKQWNVYWFAKTFLSEYARMYLERDQQGDREKAHDVLNQALEIFQTIGAKKDIEKVKARIAFIETGRVVSMPKRIDHISTGIEDLDNLLYGGIPQNYAVVLTSPSCDERDLLIKSFLEAGARKGDSTFFITIDPSVAKPLAEEFQSDFYLFVCNPEAEAIIKSSLNVYTLKGVENLTDISIALASAIRKLDSSLKKPRRICIGLVSDVLLQHHAVETRRWLTALMTKLKSEGFTALAIMNPQMHPSQEFQAILDLFDGEINIYEKETEKGRGKYLKIQKMSNQKYLEDELPLKKEQA